MSAETLKKPQVLVCQRGARHRYAIPRMFQESGMLAALYTDSSVYSSLGRVAHRLNPIGVGFSRLAALSSRRVEGIPASKIYSYDRMPGARFEEYLSKKHIRSGLQDAHVVYSMCGEEFTFLQWAKQQGAKLIIDVFVHPGTLRIVEEETRAYTGKSGTDESLIHDVENHFLRTFELADIILCPSDWVAEGVREHAPQHAHKIRIVQYGSSLSIRDHINEDPSVGRVLFAGREPLRKGLHYLADAACLIRKQGLNIDVRVAGISLEELNWMNNRSELNCLGKLPLGRMHQEFDQADVFVLPSLSEGQAGVLLEAMACGCPVIATRESGVDFKPGCGITVPARDPKALADALGCVVGDRDARNELARGALRQAVEFSAEAWKARLIQVVQDTVKI